MKAPDTVVGPDDDVRIPRTSVKTDYEVELAVVIGRQARYLDSPAEPPRVHRRLRGQQRRLASGSSSSSAAASGTRASRARRSTRSARGWCTRRRRRRRALRLRSWVNGEPRQNELAGDMIFGVPHLIWYLSQFMVLHPGDVVNTGTPAGVAMGLPGQPYLRAGDVVELAIEGWAGSASVSFRRFPQVYEQRTADTPSPSPRHRDRGSGPAPAGPRRARATRLRVVGDGAVHRDGRTVVALEEVAERLARSRTARPGASAAARTTSVTAVAEQRADVLLVAPQRRRLRAGRRRRRVRLHGREHLPDEALRRPADQADRAAGAAHPDQLVRGAPGGAGRTSRPTQDMTASNVVRRRTAAPRRRPPARSAPPRSSASARPVVEQFRGQVAGDHVRAGQGGRDRGVAGARRRRRAPAAGSDADGLDEDGPERGIDSAATAG